MQIPSFRNLTETLRKDAASPALTARIAAGTPDVDIEERLKDARQKGSKVTDLGKGMVSVRSKVDRRSLYPGTKFDGKEAQLYAVEMWDTVNKIMLGTRLYDEKGDQVLSQTLFRYENGRNLTQSTHETYGKDPRGVAYTATTDSYFRNMEFTSSITKK